MQVHVDLPARPRVVLVQERPDVHHAGVVDEHVERAEPLGDRRQEGGERLAARDVERGAELAAGRLGQLRVEVADRDARAAGGERAGGREADPAPASGHRDDASCELGHRRRTVPSRSAMDWDAEGLLEGSRTRPRGRRAARCSTSCTTTASRSTSCARRSQSSGSRCCRSSGCSAPRRATRRARSPSRPGSSSTTSRQHRRALGLAVPGPDERVYGERDLEAARTGPAVPQAGFPDDEAMEVQRVLGRGMARYAEAVRTLVGQTLLQPGTDEHALAGRLEDVSRIAPAARRAVARARLQPAPARGAAPGGDHRRAARDRPAGRRPRQRGRVRRSRRLHRARRDDPRSRSSAASPGGSCGSPRRSSSRRPRWSRRSATP